MKYLRSVRGRLLCIALVPGSALVLVALVVGVLLTRQAIRTNELAQDLAGAADRTARTIVSLQEQRNQALTIPEHRAAAFESYSQRIDRAIDDLRGYARLAPDAESGFQQRSAVDLLTIAEGMYRADSLAVAGLDAVTRRTFADTVGAYRVELRQVSGQLPESGRVLFESVTRSADWSRLAAAEDALAAGEPLPVTTAAWRAAAFNVSQQLSSLYNQQSQYAVQLTLDSGRRTLAGALASAAAICLFALLVVYVVKRLVRRVPVPVVPIMVPAARVASIPRPRHAAPPSIPDPRLMKAVVEGLRRL